MIELGAHAGFIVAAWGGVMLALGCMVAATAFSAKLVRRRLEALEAEPGTGPGR